MRKRQNLVEKYSTFLKFINRNGRLVTNWEFQPKLEKNIKRLVELAPDANAFNTLPKSVWKKNEHQRKIAAEQIGDIGIGNR